NCLGHNFLHRDKNWKWKIQRYKLNHDFPISDFPVKGNISLRKFKKMLPLKVFYPGKIVFKQETVQ
ncbi:MAG: hypothetical protein WAO81_05225, partial [Methanosarcina flavescens]